MRIYFKNGTTLEIIKQIGEAINKRIIGGCGKFQTFSDENGNLFLIVNLDEIVYVANETQTYSMFDRLTRIFNFKTT